MKIVLDASAAIVAAIGKREGDAVLEHLARASVVLAPDLFVAEVTNALWKYVAAGEMSLDDASAALDAALGLIDVTTPVSAFAPEALREAATLRHPVCDLCYAIAARREGASVLTIDKRLMKLLAAMRVPYLKLS